VIPADRADAMTLRLKASRLSPDNLSSDCLIFAMLYTCFNETSPILSLPGSIAPRILPFRSLTPAAWKRSQEVVGVRSSK